MVEREANEVDDAFRAILEGLRTTLPGVQVLFAFLLVLPLQGSFADLQIVERWAYYIAFFSAAIASIFFFAPGAHQRLRAPITGIKRHSRRDLRATVNLSIAGTVFFAIALTAAVFLVSMLVLNETMALIVSLGVAALMGWAWFYMPLVSFGRTARDTR